MWLIVGNQMLHKHLPSGRLENHTTQPEIDSKWKSSEVCHYVQTWESKKKEDDKKWYPPPAVPFSLHNPPSRHGYLTFATSLVTIFFSSTNCSSPSCSVQGNEIFVSLHPPSLGNCQLTSWQYLGPSDCWWSLKVVVFWSGPDWLLKKRKNTETPKCFSFNELRKSQLRKSELKYGTQEIVAPQALPKADKQNATKQEIPKKRHQMKSCVPKHDTKKAGPHPFRQGNRWGTWAVVLCSCEGSGGWARACLGWPQTPAPKQIHSTSKPLSRCAFWNLGSGLGPPPPFHFQVAR